MIKKLINFFVGPKVAPRRQLPPKELLTFQRQRYVCGFAFHGEGVVLIRKVKPEWQAGLLNGVGGKIEPGESPEQAMAREFKEEAGIDSLPIDWAVFARCEFRGAQVIFLRAFDEVFARSRTMTAEKIEHYSVGTIPADTIKNLRWLIPLAWHFEPTREVVVVSYDGRN